MKHFLLGATFAALAGSALAADVGVSITVGEPGFYGRIDIGNVQRPPVIYAMPLIIQPAPIGRVRQPIYLRVPPGHAKHWDKNCYKYNACNQPVYFVRDDWYLNEYAPAYRGDRGDRDDRNDGPGNHGRGHGNEHKNKGRGNH